MRLLILSDLHREVWGEMPIGIDLEAGRPDVVILGGDIDNGIGGVEWAQRAFPDIPTLYVSGNHEAYCDRIDEVERRIARVCAASPTVDYLQQKEVYIGGVRFLGCTLWTDFELFGKDRKHEAMSAALRGINDYRLIRLTSQGGRTLHPTDTAEWHDQHTFWLSERLAMPFDGPTVVITHMAPSLGSVAARYRNDILSCAFASSLEDLVSQADLWVHGHMHNSYDYAIGRCRVVCNPRGYPSRTGQAENDRFDPNFTVHVLDVEVRR